MSSTHADEPDETLDARDIDGEPFGAIMEELDSLPGGESLLLINSFESEPLYDVLEGRGFNYETTNPSAGKWHVVITPA